MPEPIHALFPTSHTVAVTHKPDGGGAPVALRGYWDATPGEVASGEGDFITRHRTTIIRFTFQSSTAPAMAEGDRINRSTLDHPVLDVASDGTLTTALLGEGVTPS